MRKVIGRVGTLKRYGRVVFGITIGLVLLGFILDGTLNRGQPIGLAFWLGLLFVIMLIGYGVVSIREHIEVTTEHLYTTTATGRKILYKYEDIEKLDLMYDAYNSYYVGIQTYVGSKGKGSLANVKFFDNRDQLAKAIVEATWRKNPKVQIDQSIIERFGSPPYGIFKSKE